MTRMVPLMLIAVALCVSACDGAPTRALRPTPGPVVRPVPPSSAVPPTVDRSLAVRPVVPQAGPAVASIHGEPVLRIRVRQSQPVAVIDAEGGVRLDAGDAAKVETVSADAPVNIRHGAGGFTITDAKGKTLRWDLPVLRIRPTRSGTAITLDGQPYPGELLLHPVTRGMDAVNHVAIEQYLPGVLTKELYGSWHPSAFEALAIAARSYAVWEASLNPDRHYDLESTTASQVYGGQTANAKAIAAVERTRGQVLSFGGQVLPAFYSSTVGTVGQDAAVVFADRVPPMAPLRGGALPAWDRASPHYRWGPIRRDTVTLARRIAAWGRANRHPIADLVGLSAITAVPGPAGRPASFEVTDQRGQRFAINAEPMRFAINASVVGLPELPFDQKVRSSHLTAVVRPDVTVFQGHGFGHGVGLSQWGAQAMALERHPPEVILGTYYPGAILRRVW